MERDVLDGRNVPQIYTYGNALVRWMMWGKLEETHLRKLRLDCVIGQYGIRTLEKAWFRRNM